MSNRLIDLWQRDPGKVAGIFYLMLTLLAIVGSLKFVVVPGEAITDTLVFVARIGMVADMFHIVFFLLLAWALYVVFSPTNRNLALLITLSIAISVAIQSVNEITNYAAIALLSGSEYTTAFSAEQVVALASFFLDVNTVGTNIATFFWFLWVFAAGYLVFTSGILHKYLGILLMIGGIGYLLIIFVFFLFPILEIVSIVGSMLAGLAEISLMIWLLVKGAKTPVDQNIEG